MINDPDKPDPRIVAALAKQYEATAARLRAQIINPTGSSDRAREWNQARASALLAQVDREVEKLKQTATKWTGPALSESMQRGIRVADRQAEQAGVRPITDPVRGTFDMVDRSAVEVLAQATVRDLHQAADSMRSQASSVLRQMAATGVSGSDVNAILSGGIIDGQPRGAIRELREALKAVHGNVVTIMDRNGAPMQFKAGYYARMVAVTKTREATVIARHTRLLDRGVDLVKIIGKRSGNFCSAYLDKVFSISGSSNKYPPLDSLPGGGPPFHPNCSKGTAPFIEALADPAEVEVGQPDPATDRMLNTNDRTSLQKQFEGLGMARDVEQRAKRLRTDAGRRSTVSRAVGDVRYQEHLLKDFGIEEVVLGGHSDVGMHILRGVQQQLSAGGTLPKRIVVNERLSYFTDPRTGRNNPEVLGVSLPNGSMAFNPAWDGWRDPKLMRQRHEIGVFSSPSRLHVVFHEMSHEHLVSIGVDHGNAALQASDIAVARRVSIRAKKNKDEFLAEFRAARMAGRRFDQQVMALYERLGGR